MGTENETNPMGGLMAMMVETSIGISKRLMDVIDEAVKNGKTSISVDRLQEVVNDGFSDVTKEDSMTNKFMSGMAKN